GRDRPDAFFSAGDFPRDAGRTGGAGPGPENGAAESDRRAFRDRARAAVRKNAWTSKRSRLHFRYLLTCLPVETLRARALERARQKRPGCRRARSNEEKVKSPGAHFCLDCAA